MNAPARIRIEDVVEVLPPRMAVIVLLPGSSVVWPQHRIDLLTKLWAEGLSCSKIAVVMGGGATRRSVGAKARRLDLPRRPKPQRKANPKSARVPNPFERRGPVMPRPPRAVVDPIVFAALPGSTPRPFSERKGTMCAWPIDMADGPTLACCEPAERMWCAPHALIGFTAQTDAQRAREARDMARALRRTG